MIKINFKAKIDGIFLKKKKRYDLYRSDCYIVVHPASLNT